MNRKKFVYSYLQIEDIYLKQEDMYSGKFWDKNMNELNSAIWIVAILAVVLVMGVFKNHMEAIINFALRGILGMMMIYFINYFFSSRMPGIEMGYNFVTFVASGILGLPGVLLLYAINLYMIW